MRAVLIAALACAAGFYWAAGMAASAAWNPWLALIGVGLYVRLRIAETPVRTSLERSAAFRAYHGRLEDGLRFLTTDTIRQAA